MSPARRRVHRGLFLATLVLSSIVSGCDVAVETGVSAAEAQSIVALLHAHHLGASTRQHSPTAGAPTFDVVVLQQEAAEAVSLLRTATPGDLAEPTTDGFKRTTPIPTLAEEQAQIAATSARELEREIELCDGVVSARVRITPPEGVARPLGSPAGPARVAVVIKHRPSTGPTLVTIRDLVSHSIPGLRPQDLFILLLEARPPVASPLVHVGPIAVTRGSAEILRIGLVAILALLGVCAVLLAWMRSRLNRQSVEDQR